MSSKPQIRIPATYMRGGTSKGVFFRLQDLPERAQVPGPARDALLCRVIGSPDATSRDTELVIVSVGRDGTTVTPLKGEKKQFGTGPDLNANVRNFLDCVKTRAKIGRVIIPTSGTIRPLSP